MNNKNILLFAISLTLIIFSTSIAYAEVPFEVVKTYVTAVDTDTHLDQPEIIVVDGIPHDPVTDGFGYPPPEGEYDHRIKVPLDGIRYKFEFWNVGEMGGAKGFIFKSSYGKAKLTITYLTGQAYKMVGTGEKVGNFQAQEKKEVSTPDIDNFEYDLVFSGGPYGTFYYTDKDGLTTHVAHVSEGSSIVIDTLPDNKTLMYEEYAFPKITNSSAFEKWMELMSTTINCAEIDNPRGDSGVRFSDYHGEVMVRPCDDEDAEYGAELGMVLHNNDVVRTGDDSTCVLTTSEMTSLVMKPGSTLIMGGKAGESKLHLIWGKIKANVDRMMKDGTMDVEMSQGVCGIKGTTFIVEESGSESVLKVIEGDVEFTDKVNGESEMINTGEVITATEEGLGKKTTFDIEEELKEWEEENLRNQSEKKMSPVFIISIVLVVLAVLGGGYFLIQKKKKDSLLEDVC